MTKKYEGTVESIGYEGCVDLRFKTKTLLRKTREKFLLPVFKRGVER